MPAPLSLLVLKRENSASKVTASARTHRDTVVARLEKRFAPHLQPGQAMPDFGTIIDLCAAEIDATCKDMGLRDREHHDELADDPPLRDLRDTQWVDLHTTTVGTRESVRGVLGPAAEKAAGFDGRLPDNPRALATFALAVADRLPTIEGKYSPRLGMTFSAQPVADRLRTQANDLLATLGLVDVEARQAEATLGRKTEGIATYDDSFVGGAGLLAAFYRLADRKDLSDRLRPSEHRPGITVEDDEATPEG
jgi:hypothetical protein